jgi:hypothetical protein
MAGANKRELIKGKESHALTATHAGGGRTVFLSFVFYFFIFFHYLNPP